MNNITLYDIINRVNFENVFADILRHVPEVADKKLQFMLAFETLRSLKPCKDAQCVIEVRGKEYLGEGVHDLWINASTIGSNIGESILGGRVQWAPMFNRPDAVRKTTNEMIIANLLWQLVAYGYPEESAILSGFILNNRRWSETTMSERIEEICSYIDIHQVPGLSHENIRKYNGANNIAWVTNITPYSLPRIKASYDITCFLDDFMWLNNETKTILIISSCEVYENEVCEIEDFANNMLKNPIIKYGEPFIPGIEVMVIFITE